MKANDEELVNLCLSGDKNAFGELVMRYQGVVYGLAYHLVGNFEDARDLAQEAFIRAYTRLSDLRDKTKFASWLKKVTFSVCLNWLKAKRRGEFALLGSKINEENICEIPASSPSPAEQVEAEEFRESVLHAVNNLPETYRLPLTLFHLDGLSYKKVAEFLDISVSAVKWRLHQARKMLRKEILNMVEEVFEEQKPDERFTKEIIENISVLVADGSPITRDAMVKLFDSDAYDYQVSILSSKNLSLNGPELLKEIVEENPQTPMIIITAYGTIKEAVEAMKLGDFHHPLTNDEIILTVRRATEHPKQAAQKQQELKSCTRCARKMRMDWQYCPYDGTEIG
ncbi:MAG: sigma-70 family RNA polymerase sigma factor [Candidatus Poribacteria bacterium]